MANDGDNVYVIDTEADLGDSIEVNDDGGIDWLTFGEVYVERTYINLNNSYDGSTPTSAWGYFYPDDSNNRGSLLVHGEVENARGSNGEDEIAGNEHDNILYGDQAADGPGAGDILFGGSGNDTVYGGAGIDQIDGAEQGDVLYGNAGNDTIYGGGGVDVVEGGAGADMISGGSDNDDTVSYASSSAGITIKINNGKTTIGQGGDAQGDKIYGFTDVIGSNFNDDITDSVKGTVRFGYNQSEFSGGGGNDSLALGGGNDTGLGGADDDKLYGEVGNDHLDGGTGNDTLVGGVGKDLLHGGGNRDLFVFQNPSDSNVAVNGRDTIDDFSHGEHDRIDLSAIDANKHKPADQKFDFIGDHGFSGDAGDLRIKASGDGFLVMGDLDGNKKEDFAILVDHVDTLVKGDFIL